MENTSVRIYNNTRFLGPKVEFVWKIYDFLKSFEYCDVPHTLASKEISLGDANIIMQVRYGSNEVYECRNRTTGQVLWTGYTASSGVPLGLSWSPNLTPRPLAKYLCIQIERCNKNSSLKDYFMMNSDGKNNEIKFTVGILDNNGDCKYKNTQVVYTLSSICLKLLSKDELISNQSTLLPDQCLTISCEIISWSFTQEVFLGTKTGTGSVSRVEAMIRDFGELLFSENTSDVKILVNDKEIPVHSQILSARSPVFAAMFRSNMEEYRTKIIDIKDARETIVRYLLKYIYTGSLPDIKDMSADTLIEMYVIADKYCIMDLKDMVMDFISRSLSEDNMERYLSLGMQHEDQDIIQSVSDFITSHHKIIRGEIWRSLARKMPDFGVQVFDRYCKRFDFV